MNQYFDFTFSLIMATYKRKQEVENFIISLLDQDFDLKKIELIIVDQNKDNFLDEIVKKYSTELKIIHIRTDIIGPSNARNIGIKNSSGEIISFPDDDCEYYPDTLQSVYNMFSSKNEVDTVLGKVFDRKSKKNIIRNWPDQKINVTRNNFFFLYTCITIFTKNKNIFFDPALGPNTYFGAYEDADYILSLIKSSSKTPIYSPVTEVNHPKLDINTMNNTKLISYGRGFGAFCRKNISPYIFFIFLGNLTYHLLKLSLATMVLNGTSIKKRHLSIMSRIQGFFNFNK